MDSPEDKGKLKFFRSEVQKRKDEERSQFEMNQFLRTSLRHSARLKKIEDGQRNRVRQLNDEEGGVGKVGEVDNQAYDDEDLLDYVATEQEMADLISYLRSKLPPKRSADLESGQNEDEDECAWNWLAQTLSHPATRSALQLHNRVAQSRETCKAKRQGRPCHEWPVDPGSSVSCADSVDRLLVSLVQRPMRGLEPTVHNASLLRTLLTSFKFKGLLWAVDALANLWLDEAGRDHQDENNQEGVFDQGDKESLADDDQLNSALVEQSSLAGCYAMLAFEEDGRGSYSDDGVRLKYIFLTKSETDFLGATIIAQGRSIIIARIVHGGLAQKTNLLHEGDELLSINGTDLLGMDLDTATNVLASMYGQIRLLVAPSERYSITPSSGDQVDAILHLRAFFSYDPEMDEYLTCKELGLPFSKGDILFVTGRRDPNWWQAYRNEGDYLQGARSSLAGLIPSPAYQFHRSIIWLQLQLQSTTIDDSDLELESLPSTDSEASESPEPPDSEAEQEDGQSQQPPSHPIGQTKSKPRWLSRLLHPRQSASDDHQGQASPAKSRDRRRRRPLFNSTVIGSIYTQSDRSSMSSSSGHQRMSSSMSEGSMDEWAAAGPVWGQHGYAIERKTKPGKRSKGGDKKKRSLSKANMSGSGSNKACCFGSQEGVARLINDYYPTMPPLHDPDSQPASDKEDSLGWLDDQCRLGFQRHVRLWTYEPVTRHLPEPLRHRPLVFVGPAHVGRHQLMQRLIQSDPDRFCSVAIHRASTSGQSTSVAKSSATATNYIDVTSDVFKQMRRRHDFIEWGLFNRVCYGTSKQTVRRHIEDGRVCCMSLRPDSILTMRNTGLLPYVIFISPPARVDQLRQLQSKLGLKVECTDAELNSCIETSARMETHYGHWFDDVVVPDTIETTLNQLLAIASDLERRPGWIPRYWLVNA